MHGLPDGIAEHASETPNWENWVTVRSLEHLLTFEPAGWAPYVAPKPLMMIVAEDDVCTNVGVQRALFEALSEPKALVSFPGGHFDAYAKFFDQTCGPASAWFETHLRATRRSGSASQATTVAH